MNQHVKYKPTIMTEIEKGIKWIVKNWDKIPDSFKTNLGGIVEGATADDSIVVFLVDRQKPTVEQSWDFYEERLGITKNGKVIWGFDSGCSCPSPWEDGAKCYSCSDTWKQFDAELDAFDNDAVDTALARIEEIKKEVPA